MILVKGDQDPSDRGQVKNPPVRLPNRGIAVFLLQSDVVDEGVEILRLEEEKRELKIN